MAQRLLLTGGEILTMDEKLGDIPGGDLLIEDGRIVAVGRDLAVSDAERLDVSGGIVIPGFIDTHRHTWETALRAIAPDATLDDYDRDVIGRFSPAFRPADVYAGNYAGALECLYGGITTLVDWSHINNSPEHPDAAVQALRDSGIRACYAYGPPTSPAMDYWFKSTLPMPGDDVRRVRSSYFSSDEGLTTMALATRGPVFSVDDVVSADWQLARELDLPITCHVGHGRHGGRFAMVANLDRLGLLGPDNTFVHACRLSDAEWQRLTESGGRVAIAPQVELQMGHGGPPVSRCLAMGVDAGLSIDVVTSVPGDMFTQMRSAFAVGRSENSEVVTTARRILEMATIGGARVAGLADRTGTLSPGKRADVVVIDTTLPNVVSYHDPAAAVVNAADTSNVLHVLVDGTFRKRAGGMVESFRRAAELLADSRAHLLRSASA